MNTVPGVCLVILDGWGLAPDGPGNAISLADTPVFDELWSKYDHTHADRVRRGGRPAGRADGQLRGRAPQPRRRRGRAAGPDADRQGGRGRLAGRERGDPRGAARRAAGAPDRARLRRRRALLRPAPEGADRARGRAGRRGPRDPRLHRRARHVAEGRREDARDGGGVVRGGGRGPDRLGHRPLLRDGPRHALGPHREGRRSCCGAGDGRARGRDRRGGLQGRLRARRDRRVHHAPRRSATRTRRSATGTPCSRSTSAPTACARSRRSSTRTASSATPA